MSAFRIFCSECDDFVCIAPLEKLVVVCSECADNDGTWPPELETED